MRQQGEVFIDLSQLQTWHLLCHGFRLCLVDEGFLPRHFPIHEPWHRQAPTIGGKATADPDLGADVLPEEKKPEESDQIDGYWGQAEVDTMSADTRNQNA